MSISQRYIADSQGNGRLEAQCFDGQKRLAHIRGKLRKKVWYVILVSQSIPQN